MYVMEEFSVGYNCTDTFVPEILRTTPMTAGLLLVCIWVISYQLMNERSEFGEIAQSDTFINEFKAKTGEIFIVLDILTPLIFLSTDYGNIIVPDAKIRTLLCPYQRLRSPLLSILV